MKKLLKVLGWSALVLLVVGAYAGYRNVRGHPFTLNQLARYRAILDGSRPRHLLREPAQHGGNAHLGMKTFSYHEGIPGHHFQIATAQGLKGLPSIRQQPIYSAYSERWALYAERLAAEIGLHAKGWSREQAIEYMVNRAGMGESEVTSEVERYLAVPLTGLERLVDEWIAREAAGATASS